MTTQNYITTMPSPDLSKANIISVGTADIDSTLPPDSHAVTLEQSAAIMAAPLQYRWDGSAVVPIPASKAEILGTCLGKLGAIAEGYQVGGVLFQAHNETTPSLFSSTTDSRVNLTGAYTLAKDGHWTDTPWTTTTGLVVLDAVDVQALAIGVGRYYSAVAQAAAQFAQQIMTASDPTTVDLTAGWPSNVVASSSGDTTPPSSGDTTPPSSGDTTPPSSGDTTPPSSGDTTPPSSGDTTPPPSSGDTTPPSSDTTPPSSGDTTPPSSGDTTPPSSGDTTPPSSGDTTPPPSSGDTTPPSSDTTPPSSGDTTPPSSDTTPPPSSGDPTPTSGNSSQPPA